MARLGILPKIQFKEDSHYWNSTGVRLFIMIQRQDLIFRRSGQAHDEGGSLPEFAFHLNAPLQLHHQMLDYGKAKTRSAFTFGPGLIHPKESFEYARLIRFRYTNPIIPDQQLTVFFTGAHGDFDSAA